MSLSKKYFNFKGEPMCKPCFALNQDEKCHGCQKIIEGKRTSVDDTLWHYKCLLCKFCGKHISKGLVFDQEDGVYHYDCFL